MVNVFVLIRTGECIRIIEADMETLPYFSNECRATLFSSTAYSDDIIPTLVKILRDILWIVATDIDPDFRHHFDRKRVNLCSRLYTGRTDLSLGMKMLKDSMGHLAAASVAGT